MAHAYDEKQKYTSNAAMTSAALKTFKKEEIFIVALDDINYRTTKAFYEAGLKNMTVVNDDKKVVATLQAKGIHAICGKLVDVTKKGLYANVYYYDWCGNIFGNETLQRYPLQEVYNSLLGNPNHFVLIGFTAAKRLGSQYGGWAKDESTEVMTYKALTSACKDAGYRVVDITDKRSYNGMIFGILYLRRDNRIKPGTADHYQWCDTKTGKTGMPGWRDF